MTKNKSTAFWTVIAVNVLALIYPIHLLSRAESPAETLVATLTFIGFIFLLTLIDAVVVVIAEAIGSKH